MGSMNTKIILSKIFGIQGPLVLFCLIWNFSKENYPY